MTRTLSLTALAVFGLVACGQLADVKRDSDLVVEEDNDPAIEQSSSTELDLRRRAGQDPLEKILSCTEPRTEYATYFFCRGTYNGYPANIWELKRSNYWGNQNNSDQVAYLACVNVLQGNLLTTWITADLATVQGPGPCRTWVSGRLSNHSGGALPADPVAADPDATVAQ